MVSNKSASNFKLVEIIYLNFQTLITIKYENIFIYKSREVFESFKFTYLELLKHMKLKLMFHTFHKKYLNIFVFNVRKLDKF